jgi:hypothetical protein
MNGNILVMKNENNRNRELLKKMGEFLFWIFQKKDDR